MDYKTILKSRTVWTVIFMFIMGGLQAVSEFLPTNVFVFVNGILSVMAVYFKLIPSQKYGGNN